jgi:putative FmdB family regulatory protein
MPIYEYQCHSCRGRVEVLVRSGDQTPSCPTCGAPLTERLFSVPYVSKGLADRTSGRTCCGQAERCDAPPCSAEGVCRHDG